MPVLTCASTLGRAWFLAIALTHHAVAQSTADSAVAVLKSPIGNVGTVSFTQVPAGVLLKVSLRGMPPGEHAFHIHTVGKCDAPSFQSAGPHFNPSNARHGILTGVGHAGDMPNLHIPPSGVLEIEFINTAITIEMGKPNSLFHSGGTSVVIHGGKDDYTTDSDGNAGGRIACGAIYRGPVAVGRSPAR